MSADYKIGNSTKMWMLSLALFFDTIQLLTPRITDSIITATAALMFMMIFIEKGALAPRASGALKIVRIILPVAEMAMGNLPTIFLTVWVQIKISRIIDDVVPEDLKKIMRARRLPGQHRQITNHKKFIASRAKKIRRIQQTNRYRKGRRGAATAASQSAQGKASRLQDKKL